MAYDYILTRNELIYSAISKLGALSPGQTLSAEYLDLGVKTLNAIVQEWTNDHVFLFSQETVTRYLVANRSTLPVDDDGIIDIAKVVLRDDEDSPLERIIYDDYLSIPNKSDSGEPNCYAFDSGSMTLYFHPVTTESIKIRIQQVYRLEDWDDPSGSGKFPVRWQQALTYALALDLAPNFATPFAERNAIKQLADYYYKRAKFGIIDKPDYDYVKGAFD